MVQKLDYAQIRQYGKLQLLASQMVEGFITGLHKSPYHGFSVEFAEHKIYNPGEGTQHIDWKVFARTDRLYTKRYEEETNLRCMLMVDTSSSMYYPQSDYAKLVFSCLAASCLANLLNKQRDATGISFFNETIDLQTEVKSSQLHLNKIYTLLEQLLQSKPPQQLRSNVAQALHTMADKMKKRAFLVIFSDMFDNLNEEDELFTALRHLKHNGHEVLLFHTFDRNTELDFNYEDKPHVFIDLETGQRVKATPQEVRDNYRTAVKSYFQNLKIKCGQYKIDFVQADVRKPLNQILLPFLSHRSKLY